MLHFYNFTSVAEEDVATKVEQSDHNLGELISAQWGTPVWRFIQKFEDPEADGAVVAATSNAFNIFIRSSLPYRFIANLKKLNEVKYLCRFLVGINKKLQDNGLFICCLETTRLRRERIYGKYPVYFRKIYYFFDYLLKRVAPSMNGTRWVYKKLTAGRNRAISYYEMIGRLIYCGFQIEHDEVIDGHHYIVARKVSLPPEKIKEHYGLLLGLERVGQNHKPIKVYKFRTMVAFSEYVQEHIYRRNHLHNGGKFRNDKRVTILGSWLRKFWIDEMPMLLNLFKGEIKLVGVRPLSPQYLALYKPEVIARRTQVKPGLIPPYYVDLPAGLDEIQASEIRYIEKWEKAPFRTDVSYFFRAVWTILSRGARSK